MLLHLLIPIQALVTANGAVASQCRQRVCVKEINQTRKMKLIPVSTSCLRENPLILFLLSSFTRSLTVAQPDSRNELAGIQRSPRTADVSQINPRWSWLLFSTIGSTSSGPGTLIAVLTIRWWKTGSSHLKLMQPPRSVHFVQGGSIRWNLLVIKGLLKKKDLESLMSLRLNRI